MWLTGRNETDASNVKGGRENVADSADFYDEFLPPTLPVVNATVDSLAKLAVKQRMFIIDHASNVKLEMMKELSSAERTGSWYLNGFALEDQDAVDFVRACPDALSSLTFMPFQDQTTLWARITSWLEFKSPESRIVNIVDDLGYALSIAEVIEVAGHLLAATSYTIADGAPRSGAPTRRQIAFELIASKHRGRSHALYLVSEIVHTAERIASHNSTTTLSIASSLYIYEPLLLGGLRGAAVNISGEKVDDLPTVDVSRGELHDLLSHKGRFVSSSTSDFVLDPSKAITSERAAKIATMSCDKLVAAANQALVSFFESETMEVEEERDQMRRKAAEIARQEEVERRLRLKEQEDALERQAAVDTASVPEYNQYDDIYSNEYGDEDDEFGNEYFNYG